MAPWLKFLIPLIFGAIGMALWIIIGDWWGLGCFVLSFFIGGIVGTRVFKRYATKEQFREDLEARVAEERFKYK